MNTINLLENAAALLDGEAMALRLAHTSGPDFNDWTGEEQAKREHDDMKSTSEQLYALAQKMSALPPSSSDVEERHTMRLAAISTAAFGYWKEGDSIHPDYDTVALRDVAKLYAKYDALYTDGWQPIETAPKDGTPILVVNAERGAPWIAQYQPVYQSGYRPDNPWFSLMLNCDWHPNRRGSFVPTAWKPLPATIATVVKEGAQA